MPGHDSEGTDARPRGPASKGFTLPEILVATAILGLLAAILLPVGYAVRERAGALACAHHLRQAGLAFGLYAQRFDEFFPHEDDGDTLPPFGCGWLKALRSHGGATAAVLRCPRAGEDPEAASYKMNSLLSTADVPFFRPAAAAHPAETPLLFDGRVDNPGVRLSPKGVWNSAARRHRGGTNLLFLDGHVESFQAPGGGRGWPGPGPYRWWP